jgi:hypothetical protein
LDWFSDYLTERYQRGIINGQTSDWTKLSSGVPQGAVLGPLLFLVFLNDIVYVIRHCSIRMFADDTCLFIVVDNRDESSELVNADLNEISSWANKWLVDFSPVKTKGIIISNKVNLDDHPPLVFNDHVIDNIKGHKHLGGGYLTI